MRILCLVDCYLPSTKSSAKLMHDLAMEFSRCGHDVVVAAPDDSLATPEQVSHENGLTVLRVKTDKIKGAGKLRRAINEIRLSAVMWKRGGDFFRDHPCDLIVYYSPTIFFGPLVHKLKKRWECPAYLVLRDIFPQWAVDAGVLGKGLIWRYFRHKELQQYAAADVIGVQSPANLTYFNDNPLADEQSLEVLFNWTALQEDAPPPGLRSKLGLDDKIVFFYGGNIGVAQDMDNILRLAEAVQTSHPQMYFLLVGAGSEVPRLNEQIAQKRLTNISIQPAVSQKEYLGLVGEFDIGLITLDRGLKTHNFPGKMLSYMYHGLPVLASINPHNDLETVLNDAQAGLVSINGDDDALRDNAIRLAENAPLRQAMGRSSRQLLEDTFSVQCAAEMILSHWESE